MTHDDCERVARLAPGWALGALDPDESAGLRAHLASCNGQHPELREAMTLAAAVGAAAPDELPSPALRARVLAALADDAPVRPRMRPVAPAPRPRWRAIAAGASAMALAASLALAVQVGENRALRDQVVALDERLTAAATDVDRARAWIDRAVARGATAYFMDGEGDARRASFMLVVEPDAAGAVLLMTGLPELPDVETYELWIERDGEIIGVGTFRPDRGGLAAVTIDASLDGIGQAMITVEPDGGSSVPSGGEVIMQGELPFRDG